MGGEGNCGHDLAGVGLGDGMRVGLGDGELGEGLTVREEMSWVVGWEPPMLRENGAGCYVEFRAFDPLQCRLRRKTIKLNHIHGVANRRRYAKDLIRRLMIQLQRGWNPWVSHDTADLPMFEEVLERYSVHIERMLVSGYFRKETYAGYRSNVKMLREFVAGRRRIVYAYQFDRKFCVDFLDYIFIERGDGAQTRNNYLNFLRVLSGFMVEKGYLQSRPTDGIAPISKRLYQKSRTVIPPDVVGQIAEHLRGRDAHFLLACYLLYYCFIRPVEMTRLRVRDFNVKDSTIVVRGECSKNRRTQTVTVPKKVLMYAIELGVLSAPGDDFIFSEKLRPGSVEIDPKIFRDHWEKLRKALQLKKEWKFYSLKDSGVTEMLEGNVATIAVRDQARHSSIAITDIYTNHKGKANPDIVGLDGAL